jgi:hypothetical protein
VSETPEPVPVRLHPDDLAALQAAPATAAPRRRAVTLRTVLLSNTNPVQNLLGHSPRRREAYVIQYGDADFVISHSENQAIAVSTAANYAQGADGALVPKLLAAPVPVPTTDEAWVTGNSTDLAGVKIIRVGLVEILDAAD